MMFAGAFNPINRTKEVNKMDEQDRFEAWGIVDLFGHTRLAGRITEQTIGGETFIRVDVPTGEAFHTRLFGKGAIYGISLTDEAIARAAAKAHSPRPVSAYDVPALLADQRPRPPSCLLDRRRTDERAL